MSIGEKIKKLRNEKEITQVELAEAIYILKDTVSLWERGKAEPSLSNCILLADYFDVTLDELCGRCKK